MPQFVETLGTLCLGGFVDIIVNSVAVKLAADLQYKGIQETLNSYLHIAPFLQQGSWASQNVTPPEDSCPAQTPKRETASLGLAHELTR